MPEAPDLVVIREFLEPRLVGRTIASATERRPLALRNMTSRPFADDIAGRSVAGISRKGKLLIFELGALPRTPALSLKGRGCEGTAAPAALPRSLNLSRKARGESPTGSTGSTATTGTDARRLIVSPMLTGALRYCEPKARMDATAMLLFDLDDGMQLRYLDDKRMGQVYYVPPERSEEIVRLEDQGPDVIDERLTLGKFKERLKPFTGEIKGVLTRGHAVSGIGNAYADEVLFAAKVYPFTRRPRLSSVQLERLHAAVYAVPGAAVVTLRKRVHSDIRRKVRDFLKVHGKGGQPCPDCGTIITAITANRRETNYCRKCQPGSLFR